MEFDEIKKIWDSQNNQPFYGMNENALHTRILSKQKKAYHITNFTELLWIIVNTSAGCTILVMNLLNESPKISMYLLAAFMLASALFMLVSRIRRINGDNQFDRSMLGDLKHAIVVATYQVHLSRLGRWSILPVAIFSLLGIWEGGKSIWVAVGIVIFFVVTNYAAGWEHNIYKARKRELEILRSKLENENGVVSSNHQ